MRVLLVLLRFSLRHVCGGMLRLVIPVPQGQRLPRVANRAVPSRADSRMQMRYTAWMLPTNLAIA